MISGIAGLQRRGSLAPLVRTRLVGKTRTVGISTGNAGPRAELRRKGLWEDVPRLPKALIDAEKENARAAAAEQNAA